jgi:hypothetical protein
VQVLLQVPLKSVEDEGEDGLVRGKVVITV